MENLDSGSFIFSCSDRATLNEEISNFANKIVGSDMVTNPDIVFFDYEERPSIGIEEAKEIIRKAQLKPYKSTNKVLVINEAEKLTPEAQNALLKTLEDIPSHTFIILAVNNSSRLLNTIISRCKMFEIQSKNELENLFNINVEELLNSDLLEKFKVVESIINSKTPKEKRDKAKELIFQLMKFYQKELNNDPSNKVTKDNINLLTQTMTAITKNVNLRLALENLMINLQN